MALYEKVIVITKRTALDELKDRFNTYDQARFYIEHMGGSFDEYLDAHRHYETAMRTVKDAVPSGVRSQFVDRAFLPSFVFGPDDLVVTLGPDGLVVNTAKYLIAQPIVALNPDPARIDGVLVPFAADAACQTLDHAVRGHFSVRDITMAKAELNDGQSLYAVNDLFIGQRTHVSARYRIAYQGNQEDQSSSGIIVSTGAGSTGWFRSVITGANGIMWKFADQGDIPPAGDRYRFDWSADHLVFSVREPFVSKITSASLVYGRIGARERLVLTSQMPQNGVIFSDGVEEDFLQFNSGAIARVGVADRKVHLVTAVGTAREDMVKAR